MSAVARHGIGLATGRGLRAGLCPSRATDRPRRASLDPLRAGRKLRSARCKASNRKGTGPRTQGFDRCAQAPNLRPQHPQPCAQGSDPRRGKDARLARKGSRFACETGGVARKAEEACAWGLRVARGVARDAHRGNGSERSFPDSAIGAGSLVDGVPATACQSFLSGCGDETYRAWYPSLRRTCCKRGNGSDPLSYWLGI